MPFVLDASVTLAWGFADEAAPPADRALDLLMSDSALVPAIWSLEVANELANAERRQRLQAADVVRFSSLLRSLPIEIDHLALDRALTSILDLARTHQVTSYDAAYLDLAMRERLPLATLDARLRALAERLGIALV